MTYHNRDAEEVRHLALATFRTLKRRDLMRLTAGSALGLALAGCGGDEEDLETATDGEPEIVYDGGVFDAGGATLRMAAWGGFWEEVQRQAVLNQFEEDFNCRIEYDSSWPWFPKYVAGGPDDPPITLTNWNLPEMLKTARAGSFFVPMNELRANVPNAERMWPFAFGSDIGITYLFGQYGYAYREDIVDPAPTTFEDFWDDRYANLRGTYITSNTLQMVFFMMASLVFGEDEQNMEAGFQAMEAAMPAKISDFTGDMQALLERREVQIGVQVDGEAYMQADQGIPIGWMYWTEREPILSQTWTVSRGAPEMEKRLAYALIDRCTSPEYQEEMGRVLFLRPTNRDADIPDNLAQIGVENTEDGAERLWIPPWDWYLDHEQEIVERTNSIFGT
jgi:putative spermidine/putrescine transport system substrate-binding protein